MENINLELLPKDSERVLKELSEGRLITARSKNDFIYIVAMDDQFHMFIHTPGNPEGGRKQYPIDEKNLAVVRKVVELADFIYLSEFDKEMDLYGVLFTTEEAILDLFPGEDRDSDGMVDFGLPDLTADLEHGDPEVE